MDAKKCLDCGAENPAEWKFCSRCGAPMERDDQEKEEPRDRFRTVVAVVIALVSIGGALVAWRVARASSFAADADVSGIVSAVNRSQALVASEADMYRDMRTYLQVRIHDLLSDSLAQESEKYPGEDPERGRLWTAAWTETFVAEQYMDQVDIGPEYIRADGSYNGQAAQDIDMAHRALSTDIDPQGRHFAQADRMREKVQSLMGLALVLSLALLFCTLAGVIKHPVKYVCLGLGCGVLVLALVFLPLIERRFG